MTTTWNDLLGRWLPMVFPTLAAHNLKMAKGDRGVMMVKIDSGEMQQMLNGARLRLDPVWLPADEFVRIIKDTPSSITAECATRWEHQLQVMDPDRDVALFFGSKIADTGGSFYTRFVVTHDGSVPVN